MGVGSARLAAGYRGADGGTLNDPVAIGEYGHERSRRQKRKAVSLTGGEGHHLLSGSGGLAPTELVAGVGDHAGEVEVGLDLHGVESQPNRMPAPSQTPCGGSWVEPFWSSPPTMRDSCTSSQPDGQLDHLPEWVEAVNMTGAARSRLPVKPEATITASAKVKSPRR